MEKLYDRIFPKKLSKTSEIWQRKVFNEYMNPSRRDTISNWNEIEWAQFNDKIGQARERLMKKIIKKKEKKRMEEFGCHVRKEQFQTKVRKI